MAGQALMERFPRDLGAFGNFNKMEVQERLLHVAIREFGSKGLDGASTRVIAAAAGTAMSSITYHYGGKEGLYLAAADHVAAKVNEHMAGGTSLGDFQQSPDDARLAIHDILSALATRMITDEDADWSLFIIREQMKPTDAVERIYGGLMVTLMERVARLISIATGSSDDLASRIAAITLFGQVSVIRALRASCLKFLKMETFDEAAKTAFKSRLAVNIDVILISMTET